MIQFKTGQSLKGRKFKLDWTVSRDTNGADQYAQVQFLEIEYFEDKKSAVVEECTNFGECSVTCGKGVQTCSNTCSNGKFGDDGCPEDSKTNSKTCELEKCQGI